MIAPARKRCLVIIGILAALTGCDRETRDTDIKLIRVAELKALVDQQQRGSANRVILIDPRPAKYFEQARLPGARNITLPQIDPKSRVDPAIDRFAVIVVYGDNPASAEARGMTKRMIAVGYNGVRLFAGGLKEWMSRGYPIEGAPPPPPAEAGAPLAEPTPPAPPEAPEPIP